jgi:hypothetical protein
MGAHPQPLNPVPLSSQFLDSGGRYQDEANTGKHTTSWGMALVIEQAEVAMVKHGGELAVTERAW